MASSSPPTNRTLKKASSFVLASLKASTEEAERNSRITGGIYPFAKRYHKSERLKRSLVCTSTAFRSLRPRWAAFLNVLESPSIDEALADLPLKNFAQAFQKTAKSADTPVARVIFTVLG